MSVEELLPGTSAEGVGFLSVDRERVRRMLRSLIVDDLVPLEDEELLDDSSLVDDVLDSLGIAEVAVFIEEQIGRPLREDEETRATFATVSSVVDFILRNR